MSMNGTDVSAFQPGSPNIGSNRFGWCKATEGVGWESPVWRQQAAAFRAAHDGTGYYHFANGLNTATAEATYFWNTIKDTWRPGEPCALDIEGQFFANAAADPVGWALAFAIVFKQLSGLTVVIYIDWQHEKAPAYNWQPLVDFGCGLWGAAYNNTGFGDPAPWPVIFCWQRSDRDESTGGDDDVVYGDLSTWQAYGTPQGAQTMALNISQEDADLIAKTILEHGVDWYGYDGKIPASGRRNTSLGLTIGWLDTLFARIPDAVLNRPLNRQGNGQSGVTSLGGIVAWFDWNQANIATAVSGHIDAAVKGLGLDLTDAQVAALSQQVAAALGPDIAKQVLAAYQAQITKP